MYSTSDFNISCLSLGVLTDIMFYLCFYILCGPQRVAEAPHQLMVIRIKEKEKTKEKCHKEG